MGVYRLDPDEIIFPLPELADEDGLLAIGGDLSVDRLLLAYSNGIFPWYDEGDPILWWAPKERYLIFPDKIHVSHSMKKYMKHHHIVVRFNRDFADTMHRCRTKREFAEGTWITDDMEKAYLALHEQGYAMSVEAFVDGQLAGGLYGVCLGRGFFGESMFSDLPNGSKIALIYLARYLQQAGGIMIDCQFHTDHLESMGGEHVSWEEYKKLLQKMFEESTPKQEGSI